MVIDEFLIALGLKVDNSDISKAEKFGDSLDDIKDGADGAESSLIRAYDATDGFVSAIEGALGVLGFFTGVLGGAFAFFHGTIMELEDLIKEEKLLADVTKEQLGQQKKYVDSVETLGKRFNSLKVELAFGFLPTMQKIISGLDSWLSANKDLIINGITGLLNAITSVFGVIGNFIRFIDMIVENTIGWKAALYVLGAALIWVNRAMLIGFATNPVFWIIAAIGVLLILIDDFMTYLDGGESEFGEFWGAMLEGIEAVSPALQKIWDMLVLGMSYLIEFGFFVTKYLGGAFVDVVQVIAAALTFIYGLFTGNTALMSAAWDGLIENLLSAFQNFAMLFEPLAQLIVGVASAAWDAIVSAFTSAIDTIVNVFSEAWNDTKSALSAAIDSMISAFIGFIGAVVGLPREILNAYVSVWTSIVSALVSAISSMISAATGFVSSIGAIFSGIFDLVTEPFRRAFDFIAEKFASLPGLISGAASAIGGLAGKAISVVSGAAATPSTGSSKGSIGGTVSNSSAKTINNYGGNTTASINMTSPNADIAANRVVSTLQNTQAKSNLGGPVFA